MEVCIIQATCLLELFLTGAIILSLPPRDHVLRVLHQPQRADAYGN